MSDENSKNSGTDPLELVKQCSPDIRVALKILKGIAQYLSRVPNIKGYEAKDFVNCQDFINKLIELVHKEGISQLEKIDLSPIEKS